MTNYAYHVAPLDHAGDLVSLHEQHGDEAYDLFADRWPEAGELSVYHAHYVHLYASREEAQCHAESFGGKVYRINLDALAEDCIDVETDELEFGHPMVRDSIPGEHLEAL